MRGEFVLRQPRRCASVRAVIVWEYRLPSLQEAGAPQSAQTMSEVLLQYDRISPTTWVYVSSLLTIGLYFKFGRLWSIRNLDLILVILLAPGMLMVVHGQMVERMPAAQAPSDAQPTGGGDDAAIEPRSGAPQALAPLGSAIASPLAAVSLLALEVEPTTAAEAPLEPLSDEPLITLDGGSAEGSLLHVAPDEPEHVVRGRRLQVKGYYWLFVVGLLILVRLLMDPNMVRRPMLEPNLSAGGLTFIGCALFVFLMANVVTGAATEEDLRGVVEAEHLLARRDTSADAESLDRHGPGWGLLYLFPAVSTRALVDVPDDLPPGEQMDVARAVAAKTMAIVSHLAIVLGMVMIGYWHFDNVKMGVGAATLFLLLPYTAEMTGHVRHAAPAALMVWAVALYRRPLLSGMLLGLAAVAYYPLYLLPLWISFYWQRGMGRFLLGVAATFLLMIVAHAFRAEDLASFWLQFKSNYGLRAPAMEGLTGIWMAWDGAYRVPILAAFIALSGSLALWPPRKNLGTLMSCSAAVMVAAQFWHRDQGGTIMAWYLPLLLLTVFRPNLEDRIAIAVLDKGRWPRLAAVSKAA